jgi:hypothetical protein
VVVLGLRWLLAAAGAVALIGCRCGSGEPDVHDAAAEYAVSYDAGAIDAAPGDRWLDEVTVHGLVPRETQQLAIFEDAVVALDGSVFREFPLAGGERRDGRLLASFGGTRHIVFGKDAIYSADPTSSEIRRIEIPGYPQLTGTPHSRVKLALSPQAPSAEGVFLIGKDLVWSAQESVYAVRAQGGRIRKLAKGSEHITRLAADENAAYFMDGWKTLGAVSPRTGRVRTLATLGTEEEGIPVAAIRAHGDRVYWVDNTKVASVPIDGGEVKRHADVEARPRWLVVTDTHLLWMQSEPEYSNIPTEATVNSVALDGETSRTLLEATLSAGGAIAHDGRLYFTTRRPEQHEAVLVSIPID